MSSHILKLKLLSEKQSIIALLGESPREDILGKISLESRLKELEAQINKFEISTPTIAETTLFLGGENVSGSYGINVNFATETLKAYQIYISTIHAARTQPNSIAETGPIPNAASSTMQLISTPRGSFGFTLKEATKDLRLTQSELYYSVEQANELISSTVIATEEDFEATIAHAQFRTLKELSNFFRVLHQHKASAHIVSAKTNISIPAEKVNFAFIRTENIEIEEKQTQKYGIFLGARTHSRDFNFKPENEKTISGKLDSQLTDADISTMNTTLQDKHCVATFSIRETKRKASNKILTRWTLLEITPNEEPLVF